VESNLLESTISSTDDGAKKTPETPCHQIWKMIRIDSQAIHHRVAK
jgi:hypothetical protein